MSILVDILGNHVPNKILDYKFRKSTQCVLISQLLFSRFRHIKEPIDSTSVSLSNLHYIKANPHNNKNNLQITNVGLSCEELTSVESITQLDFILESTPIDDGRDIEGLVNIAKHLKSVCGDSIIVLYSTSFCSKDVSMESNVKRMKEELLVGVSICGSSHKASAVVIEILQEQVETMRQLSAVAGLLLSFSSPPLLLVKMWPSCDISALIGICNALVSLNVNLVCVVLTNVALSLTQYDQLIEFLDQFPTVTICMDSFDISATLSDQASLVLPSAWEQAQVLAKIISQSSYLGRIIISSSISMRCQLRSYGGWGYYGTTKVKTLIARAIDHLNLSVSENYESRLGLDISKLFWREPPQQVELSVPTLTCHICSKRYDEASETRYSKMGFEYCSRECMSYHRARDFK